MVDYSAGGVVVEEQPAQQQEVEDETKGSKEVKKEEVPLATIAEVYSFGEGKFWYVLGGMFCSGVTGLVFPAMAYIFADSFEQLGASTSDDEFLANIRLIAYTLMGLG
jgi:hypothetical protein